MDKIDKTITALLLIGGAVFVALGGFGLWTAWIARASGKVTCLLWMAFIAALLAGLAIGALGVMFWRRTRATMESER